MNAIVGQREFTHGPFERTALASQEFKRWLHALSLWPVWSAEMKEAAEMIGHKLARMGEGDPLYADHAEDVEGYAHLLAIGVKRAGLCLNRPPIINDCGAGGANG